MDAQPARGLRLVFGDLMWPEATLRSVVTVGPDLAVGRGPEPCLEAGALGLGLSSVASYLRDLGWVIHFSGFQISPLLGGIFPLNSY